MSNLAQLSAGEAFDDFTGQPLGEGFLTFQSSAGNIIVFNGPSEYNAYRNANPGEFDTTPDTGGNSNEEIQGDN